MTTSIIWSVTVRAICHQGLVQSRARGVLVPQAETSLRTQIHALASLFNWRATIERTHTPVALVARLLRRGLLRICNFPGSLSRWSFLPRFKFFQEPSRGIFHSFEVSKVLPSFAAHVVNSSSGVRTDETNNRFQIRQEYFRG